MDPIELELLQSVAHELGHLNLYLVACDQDQAVKMLNEELRRLWNEIHRLEDERREHVR